MFINIYIALRHVCGKRDCGTTASFKREKSQFFYLGGCKNKRFYGQKEKLRTLLLNCDYFTNKVQLKE